MSGLKWKLNRIQAMGFSEVAFRLIRSVHTAIEKIKILKGWKPAIKDEFKIRNNLFGCDSESMINGFSKQFGDIEEAEISELLTKIYIFSGHSTDLSDNLDWHKDPDTGKKAPLLFGKDIDYRDENLIGNCKTLWEISRHNHLVPMAVAYAMTGRRELRQKVLQQITSWIESNPYGLGVHWCSSLEVSIRLISWCFVHALISIRDEGGIFAPDDSRTLIEESIYQHVYFIVNYLSRYSSANNHLIGELTGIWISCSMFDMGREGDKWRDQVRKELIKEASLQVFNDGVSKEQASYYHLWVNEYLLLIDLVGTRYDCEFDSVFKDRIRRMGQFLEDLQVTNGEVPQIGDADDGVAVCFDNHEKEHPYKAFLPAMQIYRPSAESSSGGKSKKAFFYSCINRDRPDDGQSVLAKAKEGKDVLKVYPEGGYAIVKDDLVHLIFDTGSLGYPSIAAHGHADSLSFILAIYGKWWLVDVGTYCYHTDSRWRNYFRGTSAHNTLSFDSLDQSLIGGDFLWLKHSKSNLLVAEVDDEQAVTVAGENSPYHSNSIKHKRTIEIRLNDRKLIINDSVELNKRTRVNAFFHLHPDVSTERIEVDKTCTLLHAKLDKQIRFRLGDSMAWKIVKGDAELPIGWYSDNLGVKRESTVLVGEGFFDSDSSIISEIEW